MIRPLPCAATVVACLALVAAPVTAQFTGGNLVNSVMDGPWSATEVWDTGVPPSKLTGDQVLVQHDIVVDAPGAEANVLSVAPPFESEFRVTDGGVLDSNLTILGPSEGFGIMRQDGGTSLHGDLRIGASLSALLLLSGGDLSVSGLFEIGSTSSPPGSVGRFEVTGGDATIASTGTLRLQGNGGLVLRPTANGAAGLSPIVANTVFIEGSPLLQVDPQYPAEVGDRWEFLTASGPVSGGFSGVGSVGPFLAMLDDSVPGVFAIEIIDSVHPIPGQDCATAVPLSIDGDASDFNLFNLFLDGSDTTCNEVGEATGDLWWSLTNPGTEPRCVRAEIPDATDLTALEVYDGCGGALLACDGNGFMAETVGVNVVVPPGETRILRMATPVSGPSFKTLFVTPVDAWVDAGGASGGVAGSPQLSGTGLVCPGANVGIELTNAAPGALCLLWGGIAPSPTPALGGTLWTVPFSLELLLSTDAAGGFSASGVWPSDLPADFFFAFQFIIQDGSTPSGLSLSNAILASNTPIF